MIEKRSFLEKSVKSLGEMYDMLAELPYMKLKDLPGSETALFIIDMLNGFAREGALKSERVNNLIPEIVKLSRAADEFQIAKLAFADCHTKDSPEFDSYPTHCMAGTGEGEIVDELREVGGYMLIPKNSTNGFLEEKFMDWLIENQHISNFIITGDCTDICIQQFSITLKAWFNMQDKKIRVIVPMNAVDTYDLGLHDGELVHVTALYNMIINGVEVVAGFE